MIANGCKVLVVDDEESIVSAIRSALKREGYEIETACHGEEAWVKIQKWKPHIVLLDVMMPKMNGFEVLKKMQHKNSSMGIILLTAKNDITDRVLGLELGSDDYMTKPFDIRELLARVKALYRRMVEKNEETDEILNGPLKIDLSKRKVTLLGTLLDLTPKEFDLMAILFKKIERVYTREDLLDLLWGMDYDGGTRTVDIHVQRIRKKLGQDHQNMIQSVYGVGYRAVEGDL
jgi:two-component system, OmpR family, alkaline phosphatase synthesis response regulator PhoP